MEPLTLVDRLITQAWPAVAERQPFLAALGLEEFGARLDDAQPSGSVAAEGVSGSWTSYGGRLDSLVLEFPDLPFGAAEQARLDERFGPPDPQVGWVAGESGIYAEATGGWEGRFTLLVLSRVAAASAKADELNAPHRAEVAATTADQLVTLTRSRPAWRTRRAWLAEAGIDVAPALEKVLPVAPISHADGVGILVGHHGRLASLRLDLDHRRFPDTFAGELAGALAERLTTARGAGRVELHARPGGTTVLASDPEVDTARQAALEAYQTVVADLMEFVSIVCGVPWPVAAPGEWQGAQQQHELRTEYFGALGCTVHEDHTFVWAAHPQYRGIWTEWDQLAAIMIALPDDAVAGALVAGAVSERLTDRFGAPDRRGCWGAAGLRVEFGASHRVWLSIGLPRALDAADDFERRRAAGTRAIR